MTRIDGAVRKLIRNRALKVQRFVSRFDQLIREGGGNPEGKAESEQVIATLKATTPEQWAKLARDMTEENQRRGHWKQEDPPSEDTLDLIIAEYQRRAGAEERAAVPALLCRTCGKKPPMPGDYECFDCFYPSLEEARKNAPDVREEERALAQWQRLRRGGR
jgi:hypothetical protein